MQRLTEVLAMGGYGAYVWPSFVVAGVVMTLLAVGSWRSLKQANKTLAKLQDSAGNET